MLALIFEPVLANKDGMGVPAPLAYQCRAGLQYDFGREGRAALLKPSSQALQTAPQRPARAAMDTFLNPMSQGSDDQIATEPDGWIDAI